MAFKQAQITNIDFDTDDNYAHVTFTIEDNEAGTEEIKVVIGSTAFEGLTTDAERIAAIENFIDDQLEFYSTEQIKRYTQKTKVKNIIKLTSGKKYDKLKVK